MNQNETIRINIDIDDRDIGNLDNVIRDLNRTLSDLDDTLSGSVRQIQDSVHEFCLLEGAVGFATGAFDLLERGLRLATIPLQNINTNIGILNGSTHLLTKKVSGAETALNLKALAAGNATTATKTLGTAMKALPIIGTIALIGSLATTIARLVPQFISSDNAVREHIDSIRRLADQYNRSGYDIVADMERMGISCTETWEAVEIATQEAAETFGGCADQIRGEIADLVYEYDNHEEAIASWNASTMEAVNEVAEQWNMCATEVVDALGEMSLDEFVAEQEANLQDLATEWGMSVAEMQEQMDRYGFSVSEMANEMEQAFERLQDGIRDQTGQMINNFREIPEQFELTGNELIDLMYTNRNRYNEWRQTMAEITEELCDTLGPYIIEHLEAQGPGMNSALREMLDHPDQWSRFVEEMEHMVEDATSHYVDGLSGTEAEQAAHFLNNGADYVRDSDLPEVVGAVADESVDRYNAGFENGDYSSIVPALKTPVEDAMNGVESTIQSGMTSIESVTTTAFTGLGSQMASSMNDISSTITSSMSGIKNTFSTGMSTVTQTARTGLSDVQSVFAGGMSGLDNDVRTSVSSIKQIFSQMSIDLQSSGSLTVTTVRNMARDMVGSMNGIEGRFNTIGRGIIDGLRNGILSREAALMATVQRIAANITRTLQSAMQINSPSRVMREKVGRYIPEGVAAGIDKYADSALASVHKLGNDLVNINLPSVESMIGMGPSMRLASAGSSSSVTNNSSYSVNNQGLFDGATINWHGEEDIRRTMEKIARATQEDSARMW